MISAFAIVVTETVPSLMGSASGDADNSILNDAEVEFDFAKAFGLSEDNASIVDLWALVGFVIAIAGYLVGMYFFSLSRESRKGQQLDEHVVDIAMDSGDNMACEEM